MFNYENQGTTTYLVYKLQKEDEVDTLIMGMLTNNKISGIAPVIYTQKDDEEFIKYNVSSKVSAKQMFSRTVDKKHLLGILKGIVDACTSVEDYMIDVSSLLLDWEYIFTDVSSGATSLICVPVKNQTRKNEKLEDMIKKLMNSLQFNHNENCDYIAYILNYLNNEEKFTYAGLKKVIADAESGNISASNNSAQPSGAQPVAAQPVAPQPVVAQPYAAQPYAAQPVVAVQPVAAQPYMAPVQQAKPIAAPSQRLGAPHTGMTGQPSLAKPSPIGQATVANKSAGAFAIPGQDNSIGAQKPVNSVPQAADIPPADPNEKEMTMFNLLCHYSKANKELYKNQKARKKAAKSQASQPAVNVPKQPAVPVGKNYSVATAPAAQSFEAQPITPVAQPVVSVAPAQAFGTPVAPAAPAQAFGTPVAPAQAFGTPVTPAAPAQAFVTPVTPAAPVQAFGTPVTPAAPAQAFGTPVTSAAPAQSFVPLQQPSPVVNAGANFGETTVLGSGIGNIGETTVLGADGIDVADQKAYFVRKKTSEKVNVTKSNFRIGKEKSYVDYFIGDNTAISRSHAEIVKKNGEFYLIDTNSTNHTFVNDIMIQSNVETKLENGSKFKLANEYFEFHLE